MSKQIKIRIKDIDKNQFEIAENASVGDYFSINDINDYDIDEIKKQIQPKINQIVDETKKEIIEKEKINWLNSFKQSDEYKKLESVKIEYENKIEIIQIEHNNEIKNFENQFKSSNEYINMIKTIEENKNKDENYNLKLKNIKLEIEKESKDKFEIEKRNLEYIIHKQDEELKSRENRNIKVMGEEFEKWVESKFYEYFGMDDSVKIEKTTIAKGGTKPDFEFIIFNDDRSKLDSVTIEVKTESRNGGKTKNHEHYEKLDKDRNNLLSEYALLVSELEPENNFLIARVPEYKNMFVVRPAYLMHFLSLIKYISFQKKSVKMLELNFKNKQKIIEEFENIKTEILDNSIKSIDKHSEIILKESEKIISSGNKIQDSITVIIERHLNTIRNKIENFKIQSLSKKIEKLDN